MKAVLPPPLFKYNSYTYHALVVAKFLGEFTKQDILDLRHEGRTRSKKGNEDYHDKLKKSLKVLERNGSIVKISATGWKITPKGVQQVMDFAIRHKAKDN